MKVTFALYSTGLAGGVRAIFKVANRLSERSYNVSIVALDGDHSWFDVKVPVRYITTGSTLRGALKPLARLARVYRLIRHGNTRDYYLTTLAAWAATGGLYVDLVRHLAEGLPDSDAYVATWYPTALSVYFGAEEGVKSTVKLVRQEILRGSVGEVSWTPTSQS